VKTVAEPLRRLPPVRDQAQLLRWLMELGPLRWSGWGDPEGVTWAELSAWQQASQTPLTPWQARALHALSAEYAAAAARALDPKAAAPRDAAADGGEVQGQVLAAFASLGA
jgi:hypothetical protein